MEKKLCTNCWKEREVHLKSRKTTRMIYGVAITHTDYYSVCPECGEYIYLETGKDFDIELQKKRQLIKKNLQRKVIKEETMFCEECGKTHNVQIILEKDWHKFGDISFDYMREINYCREKKWFYETHAQFEKKEEARLAAYQKKMERMEKENRIEVIGEEIMYCDCCGYKHNVKRMKMRDWDTCEGVSFEYTAEHLYCDEEDLYYDPDWSPDELYIKNEDAKAAAYFEALKKKEHEND